MSRTDADTSHPARVISKDKVAATREGILDKVDRPWSDDVVVALGEITKDDGYDGFGGLIDENGHLVQVEGVLQLAFIELTIFV